jgi:RNA polymerase primary sigma factor
MSAVFAGDPDAIADFVRQIAPTVWAACAHVADGEAEAREIFLDAMARLRANNFALFGEYDGRGSLESFVALNVRELLAHRMLQMLPANPEKGWRAFRALFEPDLMRLIRRRIPGAQSEATRQDAYQQIALALIDKDYARLKSYCGSGSFAGFVLRMADRLLIDFLRTLSCRRRLPLPIAKASVLEREIFKLVRWEGFPERASLIFERLSPLADNEGEVAAALERIKFCEGNQGHRTVRLAPEEAERAVAETPNPEEELAKFEDETLLSTALNVLNRALDGLSEAERAYVTIVLASGETPPSREIAEAMHCPVEEIYRLKQRVLKRLRDLLSGNAAIQNWRASV